MRTLIVAALLMSSAYAGSRSVESIVGETSALASMEGESESQLQQTGDYSADTSDEDREHAAKMIWRGYKDVPAHDEGGRHPYAGSRCIRTCFADNFFETLKYADRWTFGSGKLIRTMVSENYGGPTMVCALQGMVPDDQRTCLTFDDWQCHRDGLCIVKPTDGLDHSCKKFKKNCHSKCPERKEGPCHGDKMSKSSDSCADKRCPCGDFGVLCKKHRCCDGFVEFVDFHDVPCQGCGGRTPFDDCGSFRLNNIYRGFKTHNVTIANAHCVCCTYGIYGFEQSTISSPFVAVGANRQVDPARMYFSREVPFTPKTMTVGVGTLRHAVVRIRGYRNGRHVATQRHQIFCTEPECVVFKKCFRGINRLTVEAYHHLDRSSKDYPVISTLTICSMKK